MYECTEDVDCPCDACEHCFRAEPRLPFFKIHTAPRSPCSSALAALDLAAVSAGGARLDWARRPKAEGRQSNTLAKT